MATVNKRHSSLRFLALFQINRNNTYLKRLEKKSDVD